MKRYALTPLAEADVNAIWAAIASDNIEAAGRVEQAILEACVFLSKGPHRAHTRADLTKLNMRFWALPRYPNHTIVCVPGPCTWPRRWPRFNPSLLGDFTTIVDQCK